ncbi:MAG: hypothetical protein OXC65_02210 [Thiotrichales bacterium]|nr:hypothetical protein [Thiotrichales bacterium]
MKHITLKRTSIALAAALLVMVVAQSSALAADPEVWLRAKTGAWERSSTTFNLMCRKAGYIPDGIYVDPNNPNDPPIPTQTGSNPNVAHYAATSFIEVEGRNIGRDEGWLDDELPGDHPGRAWGHTTWGGLIQDANRHPKYELIIKLVATSDGTPIQNGLHLSSLWEESGFERMVTRRWDTRLQDKTIPIGAFCPWGDTASHSVTVTATIIGKMRL